MTGRLPSWCWRAEQLGEALGACARHSGLSQSALPAPPAAEDASVRALDAWFDAAAGNLDLEVEHVSSRFDELDRTLAAAAPALLRLPFDEEIGWVALVGARGDRLTVLAPGGVTQVPRREVVAALRRPIEAAVGADLDRVIAHAGIAERRRARVRETLLRQRVRMPVTGMWLLRARLGEKWLHQLARDGIGRSLAWLLAAHAGEYACLVLAWRLIGAGALDGRVDPGWLAAWVLLLVTGVPLHAAAVWLQGRFAVALGGLLKRRLLYGVLRLEPDEIRHLGSGQLLGKVIESEAVEALALSGGIVVLLGLVELAIAGWVLSQGGGGSWHAGLMGAWLLLIAVLGWGYYRARRAWSQRRVELTGDLVERIVGHRTRQAQMPFERWHEGEDEALERYLADAKGMDDRLVRMLVLAPRGWVLLSLAWLAPGLVQGGATLAQTAVALGGVALAHQALDKMIATAMNLAGAAIAGEQILPIFRAASRPVEPGRAEVQLAGRGERSADEPPLVEAAEIRFGYAGRGRPVIDGVSLQLHRGERVLLEGPSGGGKSTLASLLLGLRTPQQGLLLLTGLDRRTLGDAGWRRRVAAAPQFHENHVLTGTFAFNLLMGRAWPASPQDLLFAEGLCQELGLGPLLDRMPARMLQTVGDTGWQLSHGEKSRLYIARALLQDAELVVLDESFAALDPQALAAAMSCVLKRAGTVMVIAHP